MSLKPVLNILDEISDVSGTNDKLEIIKNYKDNNDFAKVVDLALNIYKKFNTTRVAFIPDLTEDFKKKYLTDNHSGLWQMLDYLSSKNGATNEDIKWLSLFASYDPETVEVVKRIINKNLKVGVGLKTFKKVFPQLPTFGVMLCGNDLYKYLNKNDYKNLCWSIKLDGVRTIIKNGKYISRNGLEYHNFSCFDDELTEFNKIYQLLTHQTDNVIPDGEMISLNFQDIMSEVRSDNFDDSNFEYHIFDIVLKDVIFKNRYTILYNIFKYAEQNNIKFNRLKLVEHHLCYPKYQSFDDITQLIDEVCQQGEEGIVLKRLDSFYIEDDRLNWCKGKKYENLEVAVDGFEYGTGKYKEMLGALKCYCFINGKKIQFNVGSGFTDQDRIDLMENLPQIIEIKYQELSNKNVPRFPVFVKARYDKSIDQLNN